MKQGEMKKRRPPMQKGVLGRLLKMLFREYKNIKPGIDYFHIHFKEFDY